LLGRNFIETCVPARFERRQQEAPRDARGGNESIVHNPIVHQVRQGTLIEWCNTLLRDNEGHVISTFSSGADFTERHEATEALRIAEEGCDSP